MTKGAAYLAAPAASSSAFDAGVLLNRYGAAAAGIAITRSGGGDERNGH